ncbi:helix-turn-helix domain-containing protein [Arabiibacter massiliensis]|uniref:helix-turn-helix domain-containing protein n=1 Tax=Arabiibacter massiliensis TaxID=1870985 RepID=UPI0009B960E1|nr:helix-turn-helix domain-containing protein [Arabiibacter massiliensis]
MLSTKEAAARLGVSEPRVRAMLGKQVLQGTKIGRTWAVSERSVESRLRARPAAGRPRKGSAAVQSPPPCDIETARRLYEECRSTLSGAFNSAFLSQAESREEESFYVAVSTFFLQQRQRELIEQGVF